MVRGVEPALRLGRPASGDLTPVGRVRHGTILPRPRAAGQARQRIDPSQLPKRPPRGITCRSRRLWIPTSRAASGSRSTERTPRSLDAMPRQHPKVHFGRGPVGISLIRAVRTHALCTHTQEGLGGRRPTAIRHEPAAQRRHLAAHTLHTHAYAGLIRPREIHPRNLPLRRATQREPAGQAPAPLHEMRAGPAVLVAGGRGSPALSGLGWRHRAWLWAVAHPRAHARRQPRRGSP